jgi:hypothetical protein
MARILVGGTETSVAEEMSDVLALVVQSKDGIRNTSGTILAPSGWLKLTAADSGDQMYVQAEHIGYVREDD